MLVGLLVIEQGPLLSVGAKPLPEIDTVLPGLTKVGLSVILGVRIELLVTVNDAEAESPVLPSALIV